MEKTYTTQDIQNGLEAARKMKMEDLIPKVFRRIQAERINPETGKPWEGVHSVYTGLKATLEAIYQKPIAEIADEAVKKGIIEVPGPRKNGYVWYLKGEKPKWDGKKKESNKANRKVGNILLDAIGR